MLCAVRRFSVYWNHHSAPFSTVGVLFKSNTKEVAVVDGVLEDLRVKISEEEIEKKRIMHRLPERVYDVFIKKETETPLLKHHFSKKALRKFYGRHGKKTGLNPGIMWPTREELQDMIDYDRMFYPPLNEMMEKIAARNAEDERQKMEYEQEVDKNMAKLDAWVKDHYDKIQEKEDKAAEAKQKRQLLIEEISEYLGYDVDPHDPRFKEAMEQKDRAKKKESRKKKEQEGYSKMLEKLSRMSDKEPKA